MARELSANRGAPYAISHRDRAIERLLVLAVGQLFERERDLDMR